MPIVQDAFDIPVDIALGIATGKFKRFGGVVRIAEGAQKGQIVKHLKPIVPEADAAVNNIAKNALQLAKKNKKAIIIAGAVVVVVAGGAAVYKVLKNKEPKEMTIVRSKLNDYISAIRTGTVDFLVVDQLAKAIDDLRALKNYNKLTFQLTPEELGLIVGQIQTYTQKLMKDNDFQCNEADKILFEKSDDSIFDLRNYLELQKKVIINAA